MSKITTASLLKMKQDGQKFTAITAYDATFAKLFDDEGAHVLLIGDSLGMVLQGGRIPWRSTWMRWSITPAVWRVVPARHWWSPTCRS